MTTLWRCCKWKRIPEAFTGEGGRYHSGRWHSTGRRIVYTSDEASLTLLEVLVNGWTLDQALRTHALTSCEFPEEFIHTIPPDELPEGWDAVEPGAGTQGWGDGWLAGMEHAAIRIPSAVMPGMNVLINPQHPDVADRLVPSREHHEWDPRLVRAATTEQ